MSRSDDLSRSVYRIEVCFSIGMNKFQAIDPECAARRNGNHLGAWGGALLRVQREIFHSFLFYFQSF